MTEHIVDSVLPVRLDRYLRRIIPSLSQGVIEQNLRKGKIKVNGKKALSSLRVSSGDKILIESRLVSERAEEQEQSKPFSLNAIKLAEKIQNEYLLFECEYFMVIDKPAKLSTQGGSKINLSIDDALRYLNFKNKTQLKLVHRLDKETSGILLIAKDYYSANKLGYAFKQRLIKKTYLAIVSGSMRKDVGEISCQITKSRAGTYDKVEVDLVNGKLAVTHYKVVKKLKNACLVEFIPLTGRTHQLRVHAQMLGCPIIGDTKYGIKISSLQEENNMFLHAAQIIIPAEIFGKEFKFEAEMPEYFKKFIEAKT